MIISFVKPFVWGVKSESARQFFYNFKPWITTSKCSVNNEEKTRLFNVKKLPKIWCLPFLIEHNAPDFFKSSSYGTILFLIQAKSNLDWNMEQHTLLPPYLVTSIMIPPEWSAWQNQEYQN